MLVVLTPDHLVVPTQRLSVRTVHIPLDNIWSTAVIGNHRRGRLIIGTRWRSFAIAIRHFDDPAAMDRFPAALRHAVLARPDGAARWAAIDARNAVAADIGSAYPWGSRVAVLVLGLAAAAQAHWLPPGDTSGLLYAGALVPALVSHGEWFRLVTANLLHVTPNQAFADALLLGFAGAALERLAGTRLMLLILLSTAVVAQATAALDGGLPSQQLLTAGLSGGILGLFGALMVATWHVRTSLPAGLRPDVVGLALVALEAVAVWISNSGIDLGGLLAGGAAGCCLGALRARGCTDIRSLRKTSRILSVTSYVVMAAWAGSIGIGLWQLDVPQARTTEQSILAAALLANDRTAARLQNEIAWEIAINPDASPALLESGTELASRAVASATRADPKSLLTAASVDTLATLDFRRGNPALAMQREFPWIDSDPAFGSHFTEFLDRTLRERGIQIIGQPGPSAPIIALSHGVIQMTVDEPAPAGARVYAVLRNHDTLLGLLVFQIPPHYTGQQILPQPWANGSPQTTPPAEFWNDPATEVQIGLFDRRSCFCRVFQMGPTYTALPPISDLPPWRPERTKLAAAP